MEYLEFKRPRMTDPDTTTPVTVQAITCPRCKDTIFSRARHDFRTCSCRGVHIDGGFAHLKMGWDPEIGPPPEPKPLEVAASRRLLYDDWNSRADKWGLIPPPA